MRNLEDFIKEELASIEHGACTMFSLVYPGDHDREIKCIVITGESDMSPAQRAKVFVDLAEEDAQEIDAIKVTYSVRSFFEQTGGTYVHRCSFKVQGNKDAEDLENASDSGERMQRMRHKEDVHEAVLKMAGITFQALNIHARQMSDDRRAERAENVELFTGLKDVLMAKALDQHHLRMEEKKYERITGLIKDGTKLISPALRMLGAPIPTNDADTSLIDAMIDDIDANDPESVEMVKMMLAKLKPATAMLLMDRMEKRAKAQAEEAAKKRKQDLEDKAKEEVVSTEGGDDNVH